MCHKCESASRCFQPGEGPSRGLLRACTTGCGTDGALHSTSLDVARDRGVHKRGLDVHPGGDLAEVPVDAAVHVVHGDDVVPGVEEVGDGGAGGEPAGEHTGVRRPVQRGEAGLQHAAGGVAAAVEL